MILRSITLSDMLVYADTQTIQLATPTSPDQRGLTVVVAPNNSGKTSILRALKFWFYGKKGVAGGDPQLPNFVNNRLREATPAGSVASAWIEVEIEVEGKDGPVLANLRRVLEVKRLDEKRWQVSDCRLHRVTKEPRFKLEPDSGDRFQRILNGLMPRTLFDAFFFMGEPLEGQLLRNVDKIRPSLGEFLHEDQWKQAEAAAFKVREQIGKTLAKLSETDAQLRGKHQAREKNQEVLANQQAALEQEQQRLSQVEAVQKEAEKRLQELGDHHGGEELKSAAERAKERRDTARKKLDRTNAELHHQVRTASGLPFLHRAVQPVGKILAQMERDNILPADISSGFVDRVIQRSHCLCGREHDDQTRANWEAYRKKTLEAKVSDGLRKLLDWVAESGPLSVSARCLSTFSSLEDLLEKRRLETEELNSAETEYRKAFAEFEKIPHEEVQQQVKTIRAAQSEVKTLHNRIDQIAQGIRKTEATLKMFEQEIREITRKSKIDIRQFDQVNAAYQRASKLYQALQQCRLRLGVFFRRHLQAAVSHSYDEVVTDGSKAHIDGNTLLPSIRVSGQETRNLGGGQSQLLALSYVVALARLRQTMHRELAKLGVHLGRGGDMPFFMDSPLGKMEDHYKRAAIDEILRSSRQLVVLLWKQEWDFARPALEPLAGSIYGIEFHTQADDLKNLTEGDRFYDFETGRRKLVKEVEGDGIRASRLVAIQ